MVANRREGIDKGGFGFGLPGRLPSGQVLGVQGVCQEDHQAKESQQARRSASDGSRTPLPLGAEAEMSVGLVKGHFDGPTQHMPGDDLKHGHAGIGTKEVKRRALAAWIAQQHPTHRQGSLAIPMP
jgi:hypothetical protein